MMRDEPPDVAREWDEFESAGDYELLADELDQAMITIAAGWFLMGSDAESDESPARRVFLDSYRLDQFEVTNVQWQQFAADGGNVPPHWDDGEFPAGTAVYPVVGVRWDEADAYCRWAGKRLPTEAEWERACRGTAGWHYPWGDDWRPDGANIASGTYADSEEAWAALVIEGEPHPCRVTDFPDDVSPGGVHGLAGNVSEWVADWYDPAAYSLLPDENPLSEGPTWSHVLRGQAWIVRAEDDTAIADMSRCAHRNASHTAGDPRVGFRCAADG